jgi:hypothetical protein
MFMYITKEYIQLSYVCRWSMPVNAKMNIHPKHTQKHRSEGINRSNRNLPVPMQSSLETWETQLMAILNRNGK